MAIAKLFTNGGSQALRIPVQFRLPGKEAFIERRGEELVIRARPSAKERGKKTLADWFALRPVAPADFMADRDTTTNVIEQPKNLFERQDH